MIAVVADARAAWRFYRDLRMWRAKRFSGHVFVRVDVHPDRVAVQARRYIHDDPAPVLRLVAGPRRDAA